eukprot:3064975-Pleurochrysis_carterae.AAC.1
MCHKLGTASVLAFFLYNPIKTRPLSPLQKNDDRAPRGARCAAGLSVPHARTRRSLPRLLDARGREKRIAHEWRHVARIGASRLDRVTRSQKSSEACALMRGGRHQERKARSEQFKYEAIENNSLAFLDTSTTAATSRPPGIRQVKQVVQIEKKGE